MKTRKFQITEHNENRKTTPWGLGSVKQVHNLDYLDIESIRGGTAARTNINLGVMRLPGDTANRFTKKDVAVATEAAINSLKYGLPVDNVHLFVEHKTHAVGETIYARLRVDTSNGAVSGELQLPEGCNIEVKEIFENYGITPGGAPPPRGSVLTKAKVFDVDIKIWDEAVEFTIMPTNEFVNMPAMQFEPYSPYPEKAGKFIAVADFWITFDAPGEYDLGIGGAIFTIV